MHQNVIRGVACHELLPLPAGGGAFERTGGERDIQRTNPEQRDDDGFVGRRTPDPPADETVVIALIGIGSLDIALAARALERAAAGGQGQKLMTSHASDDVLMHR